MAKERLPFELAKPDSNTYVTQSSEIGHNGDSLDSTFSGIEEELDTLGEDVGGIVEVANGNISKNNTNSLSIEQKVNALISCVTKLVEGVVFHSGTPFVSPTALKTQLNLLRLTSASGGGSTDTSTTSICGQAVCGQAICGN